MTTLITAASILLNALLLGRRYETLSARCWRCRESWFFGGLRKVIDRIFWWDADHCRRVYGAEVKLGIQSYGGRMAQNTTEN